MRQREQKGISLNLVLCAWPHELNCVSHNTYVAYLGGDCLGERIAYPAKKSEAMKCERMRKERRAEEIQ